MSDTATLAKPADPVKDAKPKKKTDLLNAKDRCDRCSAAAFVMVKLTKTKDNTDDTTLSFCGHHYAELEFALEPMLAEEPIDERWKLTWDRHTGTENS